MLFPGPDGCINSLNGHDVLRVHRSPIKSAFDEQHSPPTQPNSSAHLQRLDFIKPSPWASTEALASTPRTRHPPNLDPEPPARETPRATGRHSGDRTFLHPCAPYGTCATAGIAAPATATAVSVTRRHVLALARGAPTARCVKPGAGGEGRVRTACRPCCCWCRRALAGCRLGSSTEMPRRESASGSQQW